MNSSSSAKPSAAPKINYYNDTFGMAGVYAAIGMFVFFAIVAAPRTITRLSSPREAKRGWILRSNSSQKHNNSAEKMVGTSAYANYTAQSQVTLVTSRHAPNHFPAWSTILHPLSQMYSLRPVFGYSIAQLVLMAGYAVAAGVLLLLFSNPVVNPKRAGFVVISQIPVVFALGTKNSLVGMLVGRGYERLNFLHRWVGQIMFIATLFHVVSYLVLWTKLGAIEIRMTARVSITGTIALGGMSLLAVCSIPAIRARSYTIFWHTHWIGFAAMLVGVSYHVDVAIPYVLAALGIYALDMICRLVKSHFTTATIEHIGPMSTTRVTIPSTGQGWRAGQHVRLMVLSTQMGVMNVFESHPFTIASAGRDDQGLVLYIKSAGDWTRKLATLAKRPGDRERSDGSGKTVSVVVQGPYGGPGNAIFSSYSGALLICGGSGITFGLSVVQEILRDAQESSTRLTHVELVWAVQDPSSIMPLFSELDGMVQQANTKTSVALSISIHYTRATGAPPKFALPEDKSITVQAGRPNLAGVLNVLLGSVTSNGAVGTRNGVVVGVCGPMGIVEQARAAERSVEGPIRKSVGGIEMVEEAFGW